MPDSPAAGPAPGAASGPVRVRFAPSPTGLLHIGGLRTALYNYLLARQAGAEGAFLLRIEDTDQGRFVEGAEADIIESLAWAGLAYDEGPDGAGGARGPHAPYHQSARTALYDEAARRLVEAGRAYLAFDTPEALDAARAAAGGTFAYNAATRGAMANSLTLGPDEVRRRLDAGEPHVVRLRVEPGETVAFHDLIRGEVAFETDGVDDQVLVKSDGLPTYHLANVVDDHAMAVTHVVRGEEWLPSTPKHVLLYRALGWAPPAFAHLPLILAPSGGKLSKRNAETLGIPVSVRQYREAGYEPEALVNYLALLGWHPADDQEQFTLAELVERFSLDRVSHSGAKFDLDKLDWLNGQVVRALAPEAIAARARAAVEARVGPVEDAHLVAAAALLRERLTFARDLAEATYLFADPEAYDEGGVKKRWKPESARLVRAYADRLEAEAADGVPFTEASTEAAMRALAEAEGAGFGQLIHPVRLAATGTTAGAGMFETLVVLGREATLRRLRRAADVLG